MSVSSTDNRTDQLECNGSTREFPFTFPILTTSDVKVILTSPTGTDTVLTETTHYVVSAVNDDYSSGGTVTTVATYASGNTITIARNVPLTQAADFTEGMPTLYETFEDGLDKLTMIAIQNRDSLNRSLVAPETDASTIDLTLPKATDRASKYLAFDASGEPIASNTSVTETVVSTFMETVLDDTTAEDARTTLELGTAAVVDLSTDGTMAGNSDDKVPSEKAVKTYTMPLSYLDTDDTLTANSDAKVASQKAIKTYVDTEVSGIESVPVGTIIAFPTETPPTGFLELDGSSLLRSAYASLFSVLSDDYGAVDGTHFNIPDYRGQFLRGWAHGQTTDPDKATRTDRGDTTTGDHVGTKQADELESHTHALTNAIYVGQSGATQNIVTITLDQQGVIQAIENTGGNETRPTNINVMWCIKY